MTDKKPWGDTSETRWKMMYEGRVVGSSETATVAEAISVGKLLGRDSWLDCLPHHGPEACLAWLTVLTAPKESDETTFTEEQLLAHLQKLMNMRVDELFDCLILG